MIILKVIEEQHISSELDKQIRDGLCRCFARSADYFSRKRGWKGSSPTWTVVGLNETGYPVVHAGIIDRQIRNHQYPVHAVGIQNVYVIPEYRGEGLVSMMMDKIIEESKKRSVEIGLLFCRPHVQKVYTKLGWKKADIEQILIINDAGKIEERKLVHDDLYWYPILSDRAPSGIIHLQGPDW